MHQCKSILRTKIGSSDFEISVVCASKEYVVATPYYSFFALFYLSVVAYGRLTTKENFKKWLQSLMRGGCEQEIPKIVVF